jgi:mono/diheme cytochrome c family protein
MPMKQKSIRKRWMNEVVLACLVASFVPHSALGREATASEPAPPSSLTGPSWLRALAITVDTTPLGHLGGAGPPREPVDASRFRDSVRRAVSLAGTKNAEAQRSLETPFAVDGEEIYRLNCRACHGPRGAGLPPEVASIVGLARALSPALLRQNMRAKEVTVRPDLARELARQTEQSLRERLRNGGKEMPPFRHLSEPEIEALFDYLQLLADAPRSGLRNVQVTETGWRIGEHVLQGTCRICHDATGPGAGHLMMMAGRIPALANLPDQLSLEGVVHKVRHGWSGMAGMMHQMSRMPIFSYLSDEEIAAAYLYVAYYPPSG